MSSIQSELGHVIITEHAVERYLQRISENSNLSDQEVCDEILDKVYAADAIVIKLYANYRHTKNKFSFGTRHIIKPDRYVSKFLVISSGIGFLLEEVHNNGQINQQIITVYTERMTRKTIQVVNERRLHYNRRNH